MTSLGSRMQAGRDFTFQLAFRPKAALLLRLQQQDAHTAEQHDANTAEQQNTDAAELKMPGKVSPSLVMRRSRSADTPIEVLKGGLVLWTCLHVHLFMSFATDSLKTSVCRRHAPLAGCSPGQKPVMLL